MSASDAYSNPDGRYVVHPASQSGDKIVFVASAASNIVATMVSAGALTGDTTLKMYVGTTPYYVLASSTATPVNTTSFPNQTVQGTLIVNGNTQLSGTAVISGALTAGGNATFNTNVVVSGAYIGLQPAPAAKTTSVTLTAAEVFNGIITGAQGAGAAATYTLPDGSALDTGMPSGTTINSCFDFSVINISTVGLETVTVAAGSGSSLVGRGLVVCNSGAAVPSSSGAFRIRRTAANTWVCYRMA